MNSTILTIAIISYLIISPVLSENVLVLHPFCCLSAGFIIRPVAEELARRGHNVTFVSSYSIESETASQNLTDITLHQFTPYIKSMQNILVDLAHNGYTISLARNYYKVHSEVCIELFKMDFFKDWVDRSEKFDVVIMDSILNQCILPLWQYLGKSLVLFNPAQLTSTSARTFNIPRPPSYVPVLITPFGPRMNFWQRMINSIAWFLDQVTDMFIDQYFLEHIVQPYFPKARSFKDTMDKVSLVLVNGDPALDVARPLLPTVINIGGIHCKAPKTLPEGRLKEFVDGSGDEGFIVVSFGSMLNGMKSPEVIQRMFTTAFAKIKQRVVWKYESSLANLSSNVMLVDWLPQQDLLGHPKCRAFINHGGLLSIQEGIYHALPQISFLLTMTDCPANVAIAAYLGVTVHLDSSSTTLETFQSALNKVCYDEEMRANVVKYSKIFRDQMQSPVDRAAFWVEYVMRHNGALHLRGPEAGLSFIQYYLLDVIAILFVAVMIILFLFWGMFKYFFCSYFRNAFKSLPKLSLRIKTE